VAELAQQLAHHHAASYDNPSVIPTWVSDAFCWAVTGDGFTKRELYSDDDDVEARGRRGTDRARILICTRNFAVAVKNWIY
jgi:hypothetical protein